VGLLHTNSRCGYLYLLLCRLSLLYSRFGLSLRDGQLLMCNFFFLSIIICARCIMVLVCTSAVFMATVANRVF
jgi:hypothetical protein